MTKSGPPERIDKHAAARIMGCAPTTVVAKAARGDLAEAGAAKVTGKWSFNEARLRAWVKKREVETWPDEKDPEPDFLRLSPSVISAITSGGRTPRVDKKQAADRLTQTLKKLQQDANRAIKKESAKRFGKMMPD